MGACLSDVLINCKLSTKTAYPGDGCAECSPWSRRTGPPFTRPAGRAANLSIKPAFPNQISFIIAYFLMARSGSILFHLKIPWKSVKNAMCLLKLFRSSLTYGTLLLFHPASTTLPQGKHSFGSTLNLQIETQIRNLCYVSNADNQTRLPKFSRLEFK
jgi:hypothetical protein